MKCTVAWFLNRHPRSDLAAAIRRLGLAPNKQLYLGYGQISYDRRSNLYRAIQSSGWRNIVVGGRRRFRSEGYWWALYR